MYKVVWLFQLAGGQTAMNVFHVALAGSGATSEAHRNDYLSWLVAQVWPILRFVLVNTVRLIAIEMYEWTGSEYVPSTVRVVNQAGSATDQSLPPAVAMLANFGTQGPGRKGRKYLAGVNEGSWFGEAWASSALAQVGAAWVKMAVPQDLGGSLGTNWNHGVWRDNTSDAGGTFDPFNGVVVMDVEPGSQRRRRKGVGI